MKKYLLLLVFLNALPLLRAQCPDFMDLNGPNVTCYYSTPADTVSYGFFWYLSSSGDPFENTGVVPGRHTLITEQGFDPNTGNNLPLIPPGESSVIRLGNEQIGREAESITYTYTVDPDQAVLLLKYAVVFQDPGHEPPAQPKFVVRVVNEEGELVDPCAEYSVYASDRFPEFQTYIIPGSASITERTIRYLPWANIGLDLSNYAGRTVTVQFITYDCAQYGHFGYAYFTASCINARNQLSLTGCDGDQVTFSAPDNFAYYEWSNGATTPTTTYTLGEGDSMVYCSVYSFTGCLFTFTGVLTSDENIPSSSATIFDTICEGQSYNQYSFNLPEQYTLGTQTYRNTFFNPSNCSGGDVTITLHLTVIPAITNIYDDFCLGNTDYDAYGFHLSNLQEGERTDTLITPQPNGCDKVTILHLTVHPPLYYANHIYDHFCLGSSTDYDANGFHYSDLQEGELTDTLITPHPEGCDEITILHLSVHSSEFYEYHNDRACQGSSYNRYGFHYTDLQAGEITDTLVSSDVNGSICRKIVLHLTVEPLPTIQTLSGPTQVCDQESYTFTYPQVDSTLTFHWNVPNDVTVLYGGNTPSATIYFTENAPNPAHITLTTTNRCGTQSSSLDVSHNSSYYYYVQDTLCSGNEYHGNGFDLPRLDSIGWFTYITHNTSSLGCDSVQVLQLFVCNSPIVNTLAQPHDICEGESATIEAEAELPDGTYKRVINIGDIYCTDSTIVKQSAWPAPGKVAEGIVFYVDFTGEHGWVVKIENNLLDKYWSYQYQNIVRLNDYTNENDALADTSGYANTRFIRNSGVYFEAAWAVNFDRGWYLPAVGQLRILYSVIPILNTTQQMISGSPFINNYNLIYFSSTECNGTHAWGINGTGALIKLDKTTLHTIRSVRSF